MKSVDGARIRELAESHGTPFYLYDWDIIAARVDSLRSFDVIRYAQKANSNTHLLRLLRSAGVVVDAVSDGEITRALRAGYSGTTDPSGVVFTADIFSGRALDLVVEHDIPVNAGSIDMLAQLGERRPGHRVWLRVNPGFGHGHSRKTNTGGEWSKHGIWHENIRRALEVVSRCELDLVGLHMHIGSGTDFEHLRKVCDAMVKQVRDLGHDVRAISGGGGLPIPYRDGDPVIDTSALFDNWDKARKEVESIVAHPVSLEIEPGRYLAAEAGVLAATVKATKDIAGRRFVMVDAGFDNLVRPAMYGSYHAMSIVRGGALVTDDVAKTVVAGPLCESGDVFTQEEGGVVVPRDLPRAQVGDLVVFHDAGAYASTMASNYNSRMLATEILKEGDKTRVIRRRQTIDEILALEEP